MISPFPFSSALNRIWWQARAAQHKPAPDKARRVVFMGNMIFSNRTLTGVLI